MSKEKMMSVGASPEVIEAAEAFPNLDWGKLFVAFSQGLEILTNTSLTPTQKMSKILVLVLGVFNTPSPAPSPVVPGTPE